MRAVYLLATLAGCLSSVPTVPVTPANQAQVSQCETTATLHDGIVIGDMTVGIAGAGAAAAAAGVQGNVPLVQGLAVGAAVAGAITAGGAALSSLTAQQFTVAGCAAVVSPLPAGGK